MHETNGANITYAQHYNNKKSPVTDFERLVVRSKWLTEACCTLHAMEQLSNYLHSKMEVHHHDRLLVKLFSRRPVSSSSPDHPLK
jgi:hypothetical protein